jgi:hypothetical protein
MLPKHAGSAFEPLGLSSADRILVHVASRVTEEVFSFVGPATAALVGQGIVPVLVALEDAETRPWLDRFDPGVKRVLVPAGRHRLGDLARLRAATIDVLRGCPQVEGVHVHGLIPRAIGLSAIKSLGIRTPVYFSPHGSRLLGPLLGFWGRVLLRLSGTARADAPQLQIASHQVDAQRLAGVTDSQISLIESPVLRVFLEAERREASTPIIVGGGKTPEDDDAIDRFTQFAVLLRDSASHPEFYWMGSVTKAQKDRLDCVKARVIPRDNERERAELLSRAWLYFAPVGGRGVPVGLTEAMAAGVPCVAADTPFHREVVQSHVSGFLYDSQDEALQTIAKLLDSPELRRAVSQTARAEASTRFDDGAFRQRLLRAYGRAAPDETAEDARQRVERSTAATPGHA